MISIFLLTSLVWTMIAATYFHTASGIKSNDDWPEECKEKYYCWIETDSYKNLSTKFETLFREENLYHVVGDETDLRNAIRRDVADCKELERFNKIYMIRDRNNHTWYVPQTANYTIYVQIRECEQPNLRIKHILDKNERDKKNLQCREQRVNFKFPVLSQDQTKIETLSPHNGLPMYCSAKVVK